MASLVNDNGISPSLRSKISSFKVMDVMRAAAAKEKELAESGSSMRVLHLEVGQPSTGAPAKVKEVAAAALGSDRLAYTGALGLPALREKLAASYMNRYGVSVSAEEVMVTTGSSGAFVVAFTALFDPGHRVAMVSPGYPCYRNILDALGCEVVLIQSTKESDWQPTPEMLDEALEKDGGKPIHGLIVASPSNPTGTVLGDERMKDICDWCTKNQVRFISDEIYHGLTLGNRAVTALSFKPDSVIINSFSKYHCMTGWRVGWMIVKDRSLHSGMEALLQNMFISAPTLSQLAATAAFDCEDELEAHVARYKDNMKVLLEGLPKAGFDQLSQPGGAFYLYCDVTSLLAKSGTRDSLALCTKLLQEAAVATTSGLDFDPERGGKFVRFSFAGSTDDMREACQRLQAWFNALPQ